jgi:basic amino acid/polyamine antiporter, APA family
MNTPRRQLTLVDAVCLIVGVIIGVGIYECAPTVAAASSSPAAVLGFWVLGGLISLCGALCYAELATAYPRAGGDYEYLTRAYGPRAGFLFGWFLVALIRPGDIALLALIFSRYALAMAPELFPASQAWLWYRVLAVGGVILLTAIHVIGVRYGKFVQNGLTTVKVLGILAVIGLALLGGGHLARNDSTQSMSALADSTPATSNEQSIAEPVTDVSDDDVAGLAEQASTDSDDDLVPDEVPSDDQADEISGTEASGGGSGPTSAWL